MVIPFCNEAKNLPTLIAALQAQAYPNFEVIFIDDHSSDGGPAILGAAAGANVGFSIRMLSLVELPGAESLVAHKKAALAMGIEQSEAEIILTTDADCSLPPDLLERVAAAFRPEVEVVLGPVFNAPVAGFCDHFQALDLAAYQFLTATSLGGGTPTLANGACLAFRKTTFLRVDGYAGVDHLPSGDDVLLLHKFRQVLPQEAFGWLPKGEPVDTRPVTGWRALWRQRLRWAGKAGHYQAKELEWAQGLSFLASLSLLALLPLALHLRTVGPLLIAWSLKMVVDWICLSSIIRYYERGRLLRWYLPTAVLYPFFLVSVGTAALLGFKAPWKGRAAS